MAKRIGQRDVGEDERRIQMARHMFGYAYRLRGQPEPKTLEGAVTAARELLARRVTTVEPPEGMDPFYVENTDWQRPTQAARASARQLVEAVEQARVAAEFLSRTGITTTKEA